MTDARSEASASGNTDAGKVEGGIIPAACVAVQATGASWPPTTPSSTKAECVPNCNSAQCGNACASTNYVAPDPSSGTLGGFTGAPCDSGCCAANQVQIAQVGTTTPGYGITREASVRDSSGTVYTFSIDGMMYSETPLSGPSTYVNNLDCREWSGDPILGNCLNIEQGGPRIAVGGPAGGRLVCIAYNEYGNLVAPPGMSWRFGMKHGTTWTFEALPFAPGEIAIDNTGTVWTTSDGKLLRRVSTSRWAEDAIPCGVTIRSLALDDTGAMYFATGTKTMWRRDPSGVWGSETTPGVANGVHAGAGTVHYDRIATVGGTGSETTTLYYGRRTGTTWAEYAMATDPSDASLWSYELELDACGAPHAVYSIEQVLQQVNYQWPLTYVRWTAVGWRSTLVYTSLDPQGPSLTIGVDKASTTFFGGSPDVFAAIIPLR